MKRIIIFLSLVMLCFTLNAQHNHMRYKEFSSIFNNEHSLVEVDSLLRSIGYDAYHGYRYSNGNETHIWGNGCKYVDGERIKEEDTFSEVSLMLKGRYEDDVVEFTFNHPFEYQLFYESALEDGFKEMDRQRSGALTQIILTRGAGKGKEAFIFQSIVTVFDKVYRVSYSKNVK